MSTSTYLACTAQVSLKFVFSCDLEKIGDKKQVFFLKKFRVTILSFLWSKILDISIKLCKSVYNINIYQHVQNHSFLKLLNAIFNFPKISGSIEALSPGAKTTHFSLACSYAYVCFSVCFSEQLHKCPIAFFIEIGGKSLL
jgi:hypothetical protein